MADCCRPEVARDIISGKIKDGVEGTPVPILMTLGPVAHYCLRPPARSMHYDNAVFEATFRRTAMMDLQPNRVQICNFNKMADCCRPEVASDVIVGLIKEGIEVNLCANFCDPSSSGS